MGRHRLKAKDIKKDIEDNGYKFIEAYRRKMNNGYTTWGVKFYNKRKQIVDITYASFKTEIKWKYEFIKTENIYEINANIVTLIIINKNGKKIKTIFDLKNLDKIKKFRWWVIGDEATYYVAGNVNKNKPMLLHRFIVNCDDDTKVVDHINRNRLDNRESNLNICDEKTNQHNRCDNYWKWNIYN